MISFKKNVYLVKGRENACIYDLNCSDLYHLKNDDVKFLDAILGKAKNELHLNDYESGQLDFLYENSILEDSPEFNSGDIAILAKKPKIDFVWIEVTDRCNLKCIHCYDGSCMQRTARMSVEDFKIVVNELTQMDVKKIQIIGGEPLILDEQLEIMLEYCCNKMDFVEVFTNATMLNENWCRFFRDKKIHVAISVYSYEKAMHEKVTQIEDSFNWTLRGINLLKNYGVKYRVANVLLRDIEIGKCNTELFELSRKRDVVRLVGRAKKELLSADLIKKRLITEKSFSRIPNMDAISRMVYGHNCFSRRLYIAADLSVYPCVMERRIKHGDLRNNKLSKLIKDSILRFNKDNIEECCECEFRYCCHDCRPDSMGAGIGKKPWMCTYLPLEGKWQNTEEFIRNILNEADVENT